jgi:hypothetical protein
MEWKCNGCDEGPCEVKIRDGYEMGDCLLFYNSDNLPDTNPDWQPAPAPQEAQTVHANQDEGCMEHFGRECISCTDRHAKAEEIPCDTCDHGSNWRPSPASSAGEVKP